MPAETLRQRPDVRAAEHQVTAALAQVARADAARMPNFKLGGSLGLSALALGSLTSGASVVSALLAGVSLPVVDGGAARARVRAQQAALDQARLAYQATVLTALQEVEDALIALRGDRERLLRLQNAAEAAGNAALLARDRYGSGLVDFQVVLDTERTREIGLRLAIGALEREVLLQFLIEAVALAALGGLIGIVIATAASIVLAGVMGVPYLFDPAINLLSFLFSAGIGVLFGYFPARRAARMDPIEALRHE